MKRPLMSQALWGGCFFCVSTKVWTYPLSVQSSVSKGCPNVGDIDKWCETVSMERVHVIVFGATRLSVEMGFGSRDCERTFPSSQTWRAVFFSNCWGDQNGSLILQLMWDLLADV